MAHQLNGAQLATLLQNWHNPVIKGLIGTVITGGALVWYDNGFPMPDFGHLIADYAATSSTSQGSASQHIPSPNVLPSEIFGIPAAELFSAAEITVKTTVSELPTLLDSMASTITAPPLFPANGASTSPLPFTMSNEQRSATDGSGLLKIGGTVCGLAGLAAVVYTYFKKKANDKKLTLTDAEMLAYRILQLEQVSEQLKKAMEALEKAKQEKSSMQSDLDRAREEAANADLDLVDSVKREEALAKQVWSSNTSTGQLEQQVRKLTSDIAGLQSQITQLNQIQAEQTQRHQAEQQEKDGQITDLKNTIAGVEESLRIEKEQKDQLDMLNKVNTELENEQKDQLDALHTAKTQLEDELADTRILRDRMTLRQQELEQQVALAKKEHDHLASKYSKLQQEAASAEAGRDHVVKKYSRLQQEAAELKEENARIVADLTAKNSQLQQEATQVKEENARIVVDLTAKNSHLQQDAVSAEAGRDLLVKNYNKLQQEAAELKEENARVVAMNSQLQREAEAGRNHLVEDYNMLQREAEAGRYHLVDDYNTLQQEAAELKEENARIVATNSQLQREAEQAVAELTAQNVKLAAENQVLAASKDVVERTALASADRLEKLHNDNDQLRLTSLTLQNEMAQAVQQRELHQQQLNEVRNKAEVDRMERQLDHQCENDKKTTEIEQLKSEIDEKKAKIEQLEKTCADLERDAANHLNAPDETQDDDDAPTAASDESDIELCSDSSDSSDESYQSISGSVDDDPTEHFIEPPISHFSTRRKIRGHLIEHMKTLNFRRDPPYTDHKVIELPLPFLDPCFQSIPIPRPMRRRNDPPGPYQDGKDALIQCNHCKQWYDKASLCDHLPVCREFFTYAVWCERVQKVYLNNTAFKAMHSGLCGTIAGCRPPAPPIARTAPARALAAAAAPFNPGASTFTPGTLIPGVNAPMFSPLMFLQPRPE